MNGSGMDSHAAAKIAGPVRDRPFHPTCCLAGDEIALVTECLESGMWSSFKGATEGWDLRECGTMTSAAAIEYGPTDIRFLGGRFVRRLEAGFATLAGVPFAVSANSATSALVMAMGALGLGPGDEVLVPCLSFNATATAIVAANAIPVFCEIDPDTLCIDPEDAAGKVTDRTRAIMVVHFSGNAANMDAIMALAGKHDLRVIEDAAQSPGVRYRGRSVGGIGDAGVFSLTETKNITCGEGGMLVTRNPEVALRARLIRNHGEGLTGDDWSDEELSGIVGMNFRLTEIQAAVAIPQLADLAARNAARNVNWQYLLDNLADIESLHPFTVESGTGFACHAAYWHWRPGPGEPDRGTLIDGLREQGIPAGPAYGRLMHQNPMFARRIAFGVAGCPWSCQGVGEAATATYGTGGCPRSEAVNAGLVTFRFVNPPNTTDDMADVVAAFRRVLGCA